MATYSEIAITFLDSFEDNTQTNATSIGYSDFSTQNSAILTETIVDTRANSFEFSAGTDAATQAQFYKDAFDLDYIPSGDWECEISGATVTIKSTDPNIEFNTFYAGAPNDTRYSFVITNTSNTVPTTDGLMLARSNYYLSFPIVDETFQNVEMFFRTGDLTNPLTDADYEKKVFRPSVNWEYFDVLVSRFALDFLNPRPVYQDSNGVLSSETGSLVATTLRTQNNEQLSPQERVKDLLTTRGYSNYAQGANYILNSVTGILLTSTMNQIIKGGIIMIPYINDGTITDIEIFNDINSPLYNHTLVTSDITEDKIQYLFFDTSGIDTTYFSINDEVYFEVIEECKYTPQNILFLNSFGVFESFTFYKAKTESVSFNEEGEYKNNFVLGGVYDTSRHLYRNGNKNARTSITLNTGYINQEQNEVIKSILNSELVYFNDNGIFTPVNIDTKTLNVLSKLNDKLINYSLDFKYSFDRVQNV